MLYSILVRRTSLLFFSLKICGFSALGLLCVIRVRKTYMEWKMSFLSDENIIFIETEGQMDVKSLNEMVKQANQAIKDYKSMSLLVDHRKTVCRLSTIEIYERPEFLANLDFPRGAKIAEVFPRSQLKDFRFFETVSKSRGYQVSIFPDKESARKWLIEEQ